MNKTITGLLFASLTGCSPIYSPTLTKTSTIFIEPSPQKPVEEKKEKVDASQIPLDLRLETMIEKAEPIILEKGKKYPAMIGFIEVSQEICEGKAEVTLLPKIFGISCGNYSYHQFDATMEFDYSLKEDPSGNTIPYWNWNPNSSKFIIKEINLEKDNQGRSRIKTIEWHDSENEDNIPENKEIQILTKYEKNQYLMTESYTIEVTKEDIQEYQSLLEQMNVKKAELLWNRWKNKVFKTQ